MYGGTFEVFTDNNPLTYVLTTAKLDATGQRWVVTLANYNFKIFYKAGKLNLDADTLSRIPWELSPVSHTPLDMILARSRLLFPALTVKLPYLPNAVIQSRELVVRNDLELTKKQWKQEQTLDYSIKCVVDLLQSGNLLTYNCEKTDLDDMKCMLRLRKEFFLSNDLLYRKAYFKNTNKTMNQFVMPRQFRKRTVLVCHEDYGHLGMDRVLVLLQEQFYWLKMSEDVRIYIRMCERCVRFKQTPEQEEMYQITASYYPLELIHVDFLRIGGKKDKLKNILVVTDHFTCYTQCYVTEQQTAKTVADMMINQFFANYGWSDKILN